MINPREYVATTQAGQTVEQRIALARRALDAPAGTSANDAYGIAQKLIIQTILEDAEVRVRQALAETLANRTDAPRDVILALANDVDLVAVPVLSASEVLTPEELVAIIDKSDSLQKFAAIASRDEVPSAVSLGLIEKADADTAGILLNNPGADIPEAGLHRIIDLHGGEEAIKAALVNRDVLPATVIERMVSLVSSNLMGRLISRHRLPIATAARVALETRERATVGLATGLDPESLEALAEQLFENARITPSLLMRSLCMGNLDLVIAGLSVRCRVSADYARRRVLSEAAGELNELWRRAELPLIYLPVVSAAVGVLRETQAESAGLSIDRYRGLIVDRMLARCEMLGVKLAKADLEYMIAQSQDTGAELMDLLASATPQRTVNV